MRDENNITLFAYYVHILIWDIHSDEFAIEGIINVYGNELNDTDFDGVVKDFILKKSKRVKHCYIEDVDDIKRYSIKSIVKL